MTRRIRIVGTYARRDLYPTNLFIAHNVFMVVVSIPLACFGSNWTNVPDFCNKTRKVCKVCKVCKICKKSESELAENINDGNGESKNRDDDQYSQV